MLKIEDLRKYYKVSANEIFGGAEARTVKANETISFEARESETVAIVGESGCGKSTLAKVLLGLETASSGTVTLGNKDIQSTSIEMRDVKTVSSIQMVFQNPFDTLNPSHSVGSQIIRTLEKFKVGKTVAERRQRMLELLDLVKLPRQFAERKPRQLSGGQKQRIGVARAFAGNAKVVVADEPVSALDVSVQAAVTELLMDIQRKNKTTMLFISHDLSRGALHRRPRRRDVSRLHRRAGHDGPDILAALSPLYRGAAVGDPDRRHERGEEAHRAGGRHSLGDEPAERLSVPDALRLQTSGARQQMRDRGAAGQGTRRRPPEPVLAVRRRAGDHGAGHQVRRAEHAAHEGEPEDAPHGSGPGFAGEAPKRPHGKTATVQAGEFAEHAEEAEATAHARRHEHRDEVSEPRAADNHSHVAPFSPRTVGEGRQSEDEDVPSAFEPTEAENEEDAGKKKQ